MKHITKDETMPSAGQHVLQLPDDVIVEVFAALGPVEMVRCGSAVCKQWLSVSNDSTALWRHFVTKEFRLSGGDEASADWRAIYGYIFSRKQQLASSNSNHQVCTTPGGPPPQPLLGRVVFADDGSPIPGYPPENALIQSHHAWCTSSGVDQNVDLVVELSEICLITAFAAANGGRYYSAPLKEGIVFASMDSPDLDRARRYDGKEGAAWVDLLDAKCPNQASSLPHGAIMSEQQGPLVAFRFPALPDGYDARLVRRCKPTVGRYVHFKLLSSHKTPHVLSDNVDVLDLHTLGVPLPELPALLKQPTRKPRRDPSYKRIHAIRPPEANLLWAFQ